MFVLGESAIGDQRVGLVFAGSLYVPARSPLLSVYELGSIIPASCYLSRHYFHLVIEN